MNTSIFLKIPGLRINYDMPVNKFEMRDLEDILGVDAEEKLDDMGIKVIGAGLDELNQIKITEISLSKLNTLAKRLSVLESEQLFALDCLLYAKQMEDFPVSMTELIAMTYNLESLNIYPVGNNYELGEHIVSNDPQFDGLPDKILNFLDYEKIGQRELTMAKGHYYKGSYFIPNEYEPPKNIPVMTEEEEPEEYISGYGSMKSKRMQKEVHGYICRYHMTTKYSINKYREPHKPAVWILNHVSHR